MSENRTHGFWAPEVFRKDLRYRIHPPKGYVALDVPNNAYKSHGPVVINHRTPVSLEERPPGHPVEVTTQMKITERRWSLSALATVREAVESYKNRPSPVIRFAPAHRIAIEEGRNCDAVRMTTKAHAQTPTAKTASFQHEALKQLGGGLAVRRALESATRVNEGNEAERAYRFWALGQTYLQDRFGRSFAPGFDLENGLAALRRGLRLLPTKKAIKFDLAYALLHDRFGHLRAPKKTRAEALMLLTELTTGNDPHPGAHFWKGYVEFVDGLDPRALGTVTQTPPNEKSEIRMQGLRIAAVTAMEGAARGMRSARQVTPVEARREALSVAAGLLRERRLYGKATTLWQAARGQPPNAPDSTATTANRSTDHKPTTASTTPEAVARNFLTALVLALEPGIEAQERRARIETCAKLSTTAMAGQLRDARWRGTFADNFMNGRRHLSLADLADRFSTDAVQVEGEMKTGYRVQLDNGFPIYLDVVNGRARVAALGPDSLDPWRIGLQRIRDKRFEAGKTWLIWASLGPDGRIKAPYRSWLDGPGILDVEDATRLLAIATSQSDPEFAIPVLTECFQSSFWSSRRNVCQTHAKAALSRLTTLKYAKRYFKPVATSSPVFYAEMLQLAGTPSEAILHLENILKDPDLGTAQAHRIALALAEAYHDQGRFADRDKMMAHVEKAPAGPVQIPDVTQRLLWLTLISRGQAEPGVTKLFSEARHAAWASSNNASKHTFASVALQANRVDEAIHFVRESWNDPDDETTRDRTQTAHLTDFISATAIHQCGAHDFARTMAKAATIRAKTGAAKHDVLVQRAARRMKGQLAAWANDRPGRIQKNAQQLVATP